MSNIWLKNYESRLEKQSGMGKWYIKKKKNQQQWNIQEMNQNKKQTELFL